MLLSVIIYFLVFLGLLILGMTVAIYLKVKKGVDMTQAMTRLNASIDGLEAEKNLDLTAIQAVLTNGISEAELNTAADRVDAIKNEFKAAREALPQ